MMSKKSLLKEIKQIFQKELNIKVNKKSKIYDFEAWDSIGNFNILLNFEKKFKIKLNSGEFSRLNSVKEIVKVIEKKYK